MGVETALMGAGLGFQVMGAYQNSQNSRTAYEAQAKVARNNQIIAGWQAEDALARGNRSALNVRAKGRQMKGAQQAAMAANGVDTTAGSALQILTDTEYFTELDATTAKDNAAKEAWAIRNQAAGYGSEASLMAGRAAAESPGYAAAGSLLTGAGKVAASWYSPGSPGASGGRLGVPGFSSMGTYG